MAKDIGTQKRKGSVPEHNAEKVKKVKNAVASASGAPEKKRKASEDAAPLKAKKPKATNVVSLISNTDQSVSKKHKATKDKAEVKANGKHTGDEDDEVDDESDDEIDDQTAAFLKGFESEGDEEDDKINEGFKDGDEIPAIEVNDKLSNKKMKKLKKAAAFPSQGKPGVVYVGRIPHGFYENEMKAYFSQFGNILKLRLSRNKKTGASRHYAFIQFESAAVADIVARTMDNYLMFGHILKVKFVPEEQVPTNVFKGANKRFKKIPWNKMEGRKLEQGASEKVWDERAVKEQKRRDEKAEKLKSIGYEFDSPKIKSARNVAKKTEVVQQVNNGEGEVKAIEPAQDVQESIEPRKKKKKSKDVKQVEVGAGVEELTSSAKAGKSPDAKPSKEDIEESVAALISEAAGKPSKKGKKGKPKESIASGMPDIEGSERVKVAPTPEQTSKPKKDKKKKKKVETTAE